MNHSGCILVKYMVGSKCNHANGYIPAHKEHTSVGNTAA